MVHACGQLLRRLQGFLGFDGEFVERHELSSTDNLFRDQICKDVAPLRTNGVPPSKPSILAQFRRFSAAMAAAPACRFGKKTARDRRDRGRTSEHATGEMLLVFRR